MQRSVQDNDLRQRTYWLIRLRWLAALAVALGTLVCARALEIPVREMPLYAIAASLLLYNAAILVLLRRFIEAGHSGRRVRYTVNFQISADLVILTLLLHYSGGPENPLVFFFIFHMILASILLSVWESYLQATWAVLLFGLLLATESTGLLPHHCLRGFIHHCWYEEGYYLVSVFATFVVTIYLVVYMTGYVAVRLKRAEEAQKRANEQLREKDRIKDEYVAHLTHDIKGHLAAIQSCLGVAVTDSLSGPAAEFVQRAYGRTRKLTTFVRTLLRLTRLKLDGKLETEVFSLPEAVQEAVESVRSAAEQKLLRLECSLVPDAAACGNEISFKEAITNLLLNAIKYTPARGMVSVTMETEAASVVLVVSDTGIGVPPDEQARIFEEFYRASNARRIERDGDGLGLSLVKRVVELHGGTIGFESQPDCGTTFRIVLPLVSGERAPAADASSPAEVTQR
jgi:signal transduction histidine kinase